MTDVLEMCTATEFPDGSRPLVIGKPSRHADLTPCQADAVLTCGLARHATRNKERLPAGCRDQIRPGEHFLLHSFTPTPPRKSPRRYAICAACAVRDYTPWHVHEATP